MHTNSLACFGTGRMESDSIRSSGAEIEQSVILFLDLRDIAALGEDVLQTRLPDAGRLGEVLLLVAVLQLFVFFFVRLWLFKDLAHDSFPVPLSWTGFLRIPRGACMV